MGWSLTSPRQKGEIGLQAIFYMFRWKPKLFLNEVESRVMDRRGNLTNKHADENDWVRREEGLVWRSNEGSILPESQSARFILFFFVLE